MLNDFLQESPLYQDILREGEVKGEARGEARGKIEGREEERRIRVLSLRQKVLALIQRRFPQQKSLASKLLNVIEKPDTLEDVLFQLALVQTGEEVQNCLLEAIQKND